MNSELPSETSPSTSGPAADLSARPAAARRFSALQVTGIVLAVVAVTIVATLWAVKVWLFPSAFTPVTLSAREEKVLEAKLARLERIGQHRSGAQAADLLPEAYSEEGASREITLSERELNAMLAKNTDLARRLVIDLSDDLASAKLLVHLDEDFPVLGGRVVKVTAGLGLRYAQGRPVVVLKGGSVMGVPMPNAWLGGMKNVDLVREFGEGEGFWRSFAAGVDDIRVSEGQLRIRLKE